MKYKTIVIAIISIALFGTGCSMYEREPDFSGRLHPDRRGIYGEGEWPPHPSIYTQRFVWKTRYMARLLADKYPRPDRAGVTILMTTFVEVDDLSHATSFGRLLTEQMMTELDRLGFTVIEARTGSGYAIVRGKGEFLLTRDLNRLQSEHSADVALVGAYALAEESLLVNARLVNLDDSTVKAAASTQMNLNGDRFLASVIARDTLEKQGTINKSAGMGTFGLRRKVVDEEDHYAKRLDAMIHEMAGSIDESVMQEGQRPASVAVTTFVDVDHLYRAATFGRYISEKMIAEFHDRGYAVKEIRVAPDLFTDMRIGELGLTRELSQIIRNTHADALVVGTYTRAGDQLVVNGRMIMAKGGAVIGSGQMVVDAREQNNFVTGMLERVVTTVMPQETVEGF